MVAWLALIVGLIALAVLLWPKLAPAASKLGGLAKGIDWWKVAALALGLALLVVLVGQRGCAVPQWLSWFSVGSSAPFAADKLTVLVVEESNPSQDLTAPPWVNSTNSGSVRSYVLERGGDFRLIDQHNPTDIAGTKWQEAMAVKRDSVPWIVAAGPRTGFSKPLPSTAAETLSLLREVK